MTLRQIIKRSVLPGLNERAEEFDIPAVAEGRGIPRTLHQVFFSQGEESPPLAPEIQANIAHIRATNPGWDYRLYGYDEMVSFIEANYGDRILSYFDRIDPKYGAAKADLFRYLLLYKEGGVYLDVKSTVTAPLDSFLLESDTFVLSQWRNQPGQEFQGWGLHYDVRNIPGGEYQQWHVIAAPGHPFLRAVIKRVLTNIDLYLDSLHGVGKNGVLRVTGPIAYTLAIAPLRTPDNHRMLHPDDDFPLKYSIYGYDAHFDVFKSHYSRLDLPVVKPGAGKRLLSPIVSGLNRVDDMVRRR